MSNTTTPLHVSPRPPVIPHPPVPPGSTASDSIRDAANKYHDMRERFEMIKRARFNSTSGSAHGEHPSHFQLQQGNHSHMHSAYIEQLIEARKNYTLYAHSHNFHSPNMTGFLHNSNLSKPSFLINPHGPRIVGMINVNDVNAINGSEIKHLRMNPAEAAKLELLSLRNENLDARGTVPDSFVMNNDSMTIISSARKSIQHLRNDPLATAKKELESLSRENLSTRPTLTSTMDPLEQGSNNAAFPSTGADGGFMSVSLLLAGLLFLVVICFLRHMRTSVGKKLHNTSGHSEDAESAESESAESLLRQHNKGSSSSISSSSNKDSNSAGRFGDL